DLVLHGRSAQIEYDFVVAPGTNPALIEWALEGASRVTIAANGDVVIRTRLGREVRQGRPRIYQENEGKRVPIEGGYARDEGKRIRLAVGNYDPAYPLIIDPVIDWKMALGGPLDYINDIATDATGNVYLTGETWGMDFPLEGPFQPEKHGHQDAFV